MLSKPGKKGTASALMRFVFSGVMAPDHRFLWYYRGGRDAEAACRADSGRIGGACDGVLDVWRHQRHGFACRLL